MAKDHTKIVCVLDRSGSMAAIADDAIGGFNTFLKDQQEAGDNADISVYLFDNQYDPLYENRPVAQAPPLDSTTFVPRGMTALYDAVGRTINTVGAVLSQTPERDRPDKVLFVILTDGRENSSREFNKHQVFTMVEHQRSKYSWQFMYLAANEAGMKDGAAIGMRSTDSLQFVPDAPGATAAFANISESTRGYRKAGKFSVSRASKNHNS